MGYRILYQKQNPVQKFHFSCASAYVAFFDYFRSLYRRETRMPKLISEDGLRKAVKDCSFIKDGKVACAEGVKYDFRISPMILKAEFGRPINIDQLPEQEKKKLVIEPGELVFALTEERLELPNNIKADLSPKESLAITVFR